MKNKTLAIQGCKELRKYFQKENIPLYGDLVHYYYFKNNNNIIWDFTSTNDDLEVVSFDEYFKTKKQNSQNNKVMKTLSVTKTETVQIGKKKREITITVLVDNGRVRAGYSVRNPEDKKTNPELAKQISTGRALSDKTNLVDMVMGIGMDRKYILYAIVEQLFREIGSGKIQIKGIK